MSDDIAAWLTAIWDEDEQEARADRETPGSVWPEVDHRLARIAADRQILALYVAYRDAPERMTDVRSDSWWRALDEVVRLLAYPHADRPGYQGEWRPARLP